MAVALSLLLIIGGATLFAFGIVAHMGGLFIAGLVCFAVVGIYGLRGGARQNAHHS